MMNKILKSTVLLLIIISLFSCKDDETTSVYIVPLSEQAPVDDAAILEFLTNNYFNEEEFQQAALGNFIDFKFDIKFYLDETIANEDADENGTIDSNATVTGFDSNNDGVIDASDIDNTTIFNRVPLINYLGNVINGMTIETKIVLVSDVDHTLYILKAVQGQGIEKPKFCDEALLSYVGMDLKKVIFDNALNPVKLDLSSTVKGFSESVSEFNIATNAVNSGDGTITYTDYGVGAVFMPSGLGYYASPSGSIGYYSPLIFKLKVYNEKELDHDSDGIPTYLEDLNDDHNLFNDDTDSNSFPNYIDFNDDNDPVLTIEEVVISEYIMDTNVGDVEPVLGSFEFEYSREETSSGVFTIKTRTY